MYDLVGIACIQGSTQEYIDKILFHYKSIRDGAIPELSTQHVQYKEDGTRVLPFDQATRVMIENMKLKKRLECGH